jgi:hypothetical protein
MSTMSTNLVLDQEITSIIKLECLISDYLYQSNQCYVHFDFSDENNDDDSFSCKLTLMTYNQHHQRCFIMKEFIGETKLDVLNQAYLYITENMEKENFYVVDWIDLQSKKRHLSYFRGINMTEVKSKFYCNIDNINNIKIIKSND